MVLVAVAAIELPLNAGADKFPAESSSNSSGDEIELALLLPLTTFSINALEWLGFSFPSNVDINAMEFFTQNEPIKIYRIDSDKSDWHILLDVWWSTLLFILRFFSALAFFLLFQFFNKRFISWITLINITIYSNDFILLKSFRLLAPFFVVVFIQCCLKIHHFHVIS